MQQSPQELHEALPSDGLEHIASGFDTFEQIIKLVEREQLSGTVTKRLSIKENCQLFRSARTSN